MDVVSDFGVPEPNKTPNRHIIRLQKRYPHLFTIEFSELGKFKKLGAGSFGTVYKSVYRGENVAVKRIETNGDSDTYKYLVREILNLSKVNHNNILKFIGLSHEQQREVYMITDLVEGGSLDKIHKKIKKTSSPYAIFIQILCKVAFAMRYLNSQNMIHRDLKPANILVSSDFQTVKLCDFGLSVIPDNDVGLSSKEKNIPSLQRKMTCVGTGNYMAPEMKTGEGNFASDIYSYGVMTATLLGYPSKLGKKPFNPSVFEKKKDKHAPKELVALVTSCTQKDPKKRPTFSAIVSKLIEMHNSLFREFPPLKDENADIAMDVETVSISRTSSKGQIKRRSRVKSMELVPNSFPVGRARGVVTLQAPNREILLGAAFANTT